MTDGHIDGLCDCHSSVKHPSSLCYLLQNARILFNGNLMDLCFYKDFEFLIKINMDIRRSLCFTFIKEECELRYTQMWWECVTPGDCILLNYWGWTFPKRAYIRSHHHVRHQSFTMYNELYFPNRKLIKFYSKWLAGNCASTTLLL